MFTIDGIEWRYPCAITREAEIKPSEISGMLLDRTYFNDVIGTFMQYTVGIAVPTNRRDDYDTIYEKLTDPVDGHVMTLPYNQGTLTITARVENVQDEYVRLSKNGQYWRGLEFTAIANHPSKQMSLGDVLARGRSPLPDLAEVEIGAVYTYTSTGWVITVYQDGDQIYY